MTKEDAIKILNTVLCLGKCDCSKDEIEECLKMAIKALETQPSENEKIIRISKGTLKARTGKYVIYDVEWLKTHFNTTEAKIYGQPSEDWNAVLDELNRIGRNAFKDDTDYDNLFDFISNLPNVTPQSKAEPQQKTGHWVLSGGYWRCSECKEKALLKLDKATGGYREYEPVRSKYCPECGAKMQEEKK